jgi:hypothetical protein
LFLKCVKPSLAPYRNSLRQGKRICKQNQILPIFFYRRRKNKYQEKAHVY